MQLASPSAAEIPELHPIFATRRSSFDENESPDAADVGASAILRGYLNALQSAGSGDTIHEASFVQDDDAFLEGARRVREHLQQVTADGMSSCLICLEDIRPTDPIWHCCGAGEPHACYVVLHLGCIQSWARQQLAVAEAALVRNAAAIADGDPTHHRRLAKTYANPCWGCPKCRKEYPGSNIPSASKCFCGQTVDAPFDPWNAPHSCGSQCSRPNEHCGHECLLLCHPGPCPPCPRAVPATCHCGKQHGHRRCGRTEFSCNARCDNTLPCGHACNATCHPGPCPPCPLRSTATCPCGAASKELPCAGHGAFRCDKVCGRSLACAVHSCRRVCCDGNCGPCPLSGKKSCPCGKVTSTQATCGVVVPPCGQTCDKVLECGVHRCTERCHEGACPSTCRATVEKTCACGKVRFFVFFILIGYLLRVRYMLAFRCANGATQSGLYAVPRGLICWLAVSRITALVLADDEERFVFGKLSLRAEVRFHAFLWTASMSQTLLYGRLPPMHGNLRAKAQVWQP
jgi:hypothetical protein